MYLSDLIKFQKEIHIICLDKKMLKISRFDEKFRYIDTKNIYLQYTMDFPEISTGNVGSDKYYIEFRWPKEGLMIFQTYLIFVDTNLNIKKIYIPKSIHIIPFENFSLNDKLLILNLEYDEYRNLKRPYLTHLFKYMDLDGKIADTGIIDSSAFNIQKVYENLTKPGCVGNQCIYFSPVEPNKIVKKHDKDKLHRIDLYQIDIEKRDITHFSDFNSGYQKILMISDQGKVISAKGEIFSSYYDFDANTFYAQVHSSKIIKTIGTRRKESRAEWYLLKYDIKSNRYDVKANWGYLTKFMGKYSGKMIFYTPVERIEWQNNQRIVNGIDFIFYEF
jgi:hypothetical protein